MEKLVDAQRRCIIFHFTETARVKWMRQTLCWQSQYNVATRDLVITLIDADVFS